MTSFVAFDRCNARLTDQGPAFAHPKVPPTNALKERRHVEFPVKSPGIQLAE
ncbi:MAG: hypothetical protein ACKOEO_22865 [Planctomycetaceae bacterium]